MVFTGREYDCLRMVFSVPMSNLRRRGCILVLSCLVLVPFFGIVLFSAPDMGSEEVLIQRMAELQVRLQYLDSMYRARQEEVQTLSHQVNQIGENVSSSSPQLYTLKPEVKQMLKNMSGWRFTQGLFPSYTVRLPSSFYFLPHLLDDMSSLRPAYLLSKGRMGVSMVLGIPTVKRDKQSYLMDTLQNLLEAISEEEALDTVIVVFVAEADLEYVLEVAKEIESRFPLHIDSGLIEIISPSPSYYPDFSKLRQTLGDPPERVRWRSKQNLDFAFLMSYAQPKGTFYVQLEDDIVAKRNFITTMKNFAIEKIGGKMPWFVLDFCQLGFIGKLFKSAELPWLVQYFQMFFNDKPVDWLLDYFIVTKICNWGKDMKHCKKEKEQLWIHYKPSLFQHVGMHSSLKGKVQKLKDKQFGKVPLFFPHANPEAQVESDIKAYKYYTLSRAYGGENFFWGLLPQPGDHLTFKFSSPISIRRYLFRSGNAEHPADKLYNTTVEVLPESTDLDIKNMNLTSDGYIIVGKFDNNGVAEGTVEDSIGRVRVLRITVHTESENWAILSEIHIQDESR